MTVEPASSQLPEPILVVGGYGYRNVGDEAILASLLRTFEGRAMTVVSRLPAETAAMHGVRAVPISAAVPELRRHRTLLIGGGGLFGSDVGMVGRLLPAYGLAAAALGRTVALHGVGIDPDMPRPTAVALRHLARRASHVLVRDRRSADVLRGWGVDAAVGPDLSAWLPAAPPSAGTALLRAAGLDPRRPIVGLSLTAVNPAVSDATVEAVTECVDALPELQFCFIPMSQHPFVAAHNDLLLARQVQARQPRLRVLGGTPQPAQILALYGHLAAAVCMRYHSLLFAARAGIPIIPIAYAEKCRAWLAERGEAAVEPTAAALVDNIRRAVSVQGAAS
ncbi:MAG: polysaccharide pyruvyl transferase family protein [Candidatus Limnocylindria bacterium]